MTAADAVAFAEELSRAAASGGGAGALAELLARRTGTGVLLEDGEWRHLAAAGGTALPPSARALLPENGGGRALHAIAGSTPGISLALYAGETRLGQLSIFGGRDPGAFEHVIRLAAAAIAVELARDRDAQPRRRRAFWERLAGRQYLDSATARDDAAARGIAVAEHYVAIALEAESAEERSTAADQGILREEASRALRSTHGTVGTLERGNTLLFFVPAPREIDAANARTAATLLPRTLAKKHVDLRAGGGVGRRVPVMTLHESIAQAEAALTIARRMYGAGRVGVYDDLGAYPLLLCGAEAPALREFAARTLAPLRAYDDKHQTELERTLRLYFDLGENVKTAAGELAVHRHTVFYRLRQIGEICGCKLDDPRDQLTLRMAMAIDALTK